jgi:hypothetical protein
LPIPGGGDKETLQWGIDERPGAVHLLLTDQTLPMITPTQKFTVETWFDRSSRNWITQIKDLDGNQVGDALFAGRRDSAVVNHSDAVALALALA